MRRGRMKCQLKLPLQRGCRAYESASLVGSFHFSCGRDCVVRLCFGRPKFRRGADGGSVNISLSSLQLDMSARFAHVERVLI